MPARQNNGRSSLRANQTISFFFVTGFGPGAYPAKLFAGTKQRFSGFSRLRPCGEKVLRILVTGEPPVRCFAEHDPEGVTRASVLTFIALSSAAFAQGGGSGGGSGGGASGSGAASGGSTSGNSAPATQSGAQPGQDKSGMSTTTTGNNMSPRSTRANWDRHATIERSHGRRQRTRRGCWPFGERLAHRQPGIGTRVAGGPCRCQKALSHQVGHLPDRASCAIDRYRDGMRLPVSNICIRRLLGAVNRIIVPWGSSQR